MAHEDEVKTSTEPKEDPPKAAEETEVAATTEEPPKATEEDKKEEETKEAMKEDASEVPAPVKKRDSDAAMLDSTHAAPEESAADKKAKVDAVPETVAEEAKEGETKETKEAQ